MYLSEPPKYEDIDWVSLARIMGISLRKSGDTIVLSIMSEAERLSLIEHYSASSISLTQITDELNEFMLEGRATSFDKARIKLMVNRSRK